MAHSLKMKRELIMQKEIDAIKGALESYLN